jgi:2-iminobutanoate/2-iminopropanoate deaminase
MADKTVIEGANPAIGPYSPALHHGNRLYISGQIPVNPADGSIPEALTEQTKVVMEHISSLLDKAGFSFSDLVKTTIYTTELSGFTDINEVYQSFLTKPYPARATIEVSALPKGVKVEIEAIAERS